MHSLVSGFELIVHGGFMMYSLLISAIIALTVIIERLFVLQNNYKTSPEFVATVFKKIQSNQLSQANETCKKVSTPITAVIMAGIEHFENPIEEMELSMKNQAEA